MAAYFLAAVKVHDSETFQNYVEGGFASMKNYAPEVLVVDQNPEALEGGIPGHHIVILKFRDKEDLHKWWNSEEYTKAKRFRHESADTPFILALDSYEAE